jgi:hypothetical protein
MIDFIEKFEERLRKKYKGGSVSVDDIIALAIELLGDKMEWVNFKVKEGEREKLKNDAHAHRMNISEYLRFLIEKERQDMRKEDEWK